MSAKPQRRPYKTKDGYISVMPYINKHWANFFAMIGQPELMDDPRFKDMASRTEHIGEVYQILADALLEKTMGEWLPLLEEADIPVMPMHTMETVLEDEHLKATGFYQMVDHPTEGRLRTMAVPVSWSKTPPQPERQAPRLGEHSAEILHEAGYSDEEIQALKAEGVTVSPEDETDA